MSTDQPCCTHACPPPDIPYSGAAVGQSSAGQGCRCERNSDHVIGATVTASGRNGPRRQNLCTLAAQRCAFGRVVANRTKSWLTDLPTTAGQSIRTAKPDAPDPGRGDPFS
ncbi:hypothetical protein GCM10027610_080860 [Dactylosporangium cerinum]